ncbi:MAG: DUF2059 domain-containing protein [Victivallales bacterium]|jgi:hypothetical protein
MNGGFQKFLVFSLFISLSFVMVGGDAQNPLKEKEGKKEKAVKVLKISGAAQTYIEALLEGIKQAPIPFEDKELYSKFATSDSIMDYFVPVYMEKYTEEELDAMIDFYSSPVGQSIVKKSLPVVIELRKASMQWGMQMSVRVNSEKARIAAEKDK